MHGCDSGALMFSSFQSQSHLNMGSLMEQLTTFVDNALTYFTPSVFSNRTQNKISQIPFYDFDILCVSSKKIKSLPLE